MAADGTTGGRTKSTRDVRIVAALAAGQSYDQVAAEFRVSKRTLVRRMADPAFQVEVRQARTQLLAEATGILAGEAAATARALVTLRDGAEGDATRLGACRVILDRLVAAQELMELESRISALEKGASP
jgi:hypothetical protein